MAREASQGCLPSVLRFLGINQASGEAAGLLPYLRKDYLLTKAERSFFHALFDVAGGRFHVFAMVRLADLVYIPRGTERRQSYFNRIRSKHVDFVLCELESIRPMLAIELDDASHSRRDRKERDVFVEEALRVAGLPLLRIPVRRDYSPHGLERQIRESMGATGADDVLPS
ncbi:MAG: hypothetical protein CMJ18_20905 [Phycisphaeraceae bacterium]|nr:hypothetical protein [Phycisphaeraceae bacterium]